jgi:hypothetical protein
MGWKELLESVSESLVVMPLVQDVQRMFSLVLQSLDGSVCRRQREISLVKQGARSGAMRGGVSILGNTIAERLSREARHSPSQALGIVVFLPSVTAHSIRDKPQWRRPRRDVLLAESLRGVA